VTGTTARLEAGLRSRALDFVGGYSLVEAGLAPAEPGAADAGPGGREFIGREALRAALAADPPVAILSTLAMDDQRGPDGVARFVLGQEPILARDGRILIDARGRRSFVTSAGSAPSLGRHLLTAYLPAAEAAIGNRLLVECFGDRYPVTVVANAPGPVLIPSVD
jgi:glycine cleavage system aminomethyltransferase T